LELFTALIGIYLSDVSELDHGNFTVWPGSHRTIATYLAQNLDANADNIYEVIRGIGQIDCGEPLQIRARAGDVVICHSLLKHGTAPNLGSNIRYMVFVRARHQDQNRAHVDGEEDCWKWWRGLQGVNLVERL
jgi:hypothetical protein